MYQGRELKRRVEESTSKGIREFHKIKKFKKQKSNYNSLKYNKKFMTMGPKIIFMTTK